MSGKFILTDEFVVERSFAVEGSDGKIVLQLAAPPRSRFSFAEKMAAAAEGKEKDALVRFCARHARGWNVCDKNGEALPCDIGNAERVFDIVPGLAEAAFAALVRVAKDGGEKDAAEKKPSPNSTPPLPGATPAGAK